MTDITVRGAGITGLMCAWFLQKRGLVVRIVDPHGVGAGASGGIVGALAPHVPENWNPKKALQFRALDEAEALWAEIAEACGHDPGYARTGRVQPLDSEAAVELAMVRSEAAEELWEGRYEWKVTKSEEFRIPSLTGLLVHDSLTARLHPRRACTALAAALTAKGAEIVPEASAAGKELWATGIADLREISEALGRKIGSPIKGQAALLKADMATVPQIFANGLHIVPHFDGTVAVGSTTEREFEDPAATDARLEPLIAAARRVCPALAKAPVVERWAGFRPRARSRAPMVGKHPTRPGAYIANGGFKIGLAMAPVMARMLTDLIVDACDTIPSDFRPEASL